LNILRFFFDTETYKAYVEEIISLYRLLDYNHDMFVLSYPLNVNYRSLETLVMWTLDLRKSYHVEIVL